MNASRMIVRMLILAALVLTLGGCALHSELECSVRGRYQPTYLSPPQVADIRTTWKISID